MFILGDTRHSVRLFDSLAALTQSASHPQTLFTMSALLALLLLIVGIIAPMIEINARIKEMSFLLIGEKILFTREVICFQSENIVDVVRIIVETGKFDLVSVNVLVFSILVSVAKLLSTKAYLLGSERWRHNKFIQFFAFKSDKWSMADVCRSQFYGLYRLYGNT